VWHCSLVLVINGEKASFFTKVAITLVYLWCLRVDRISPISCWLRYRQIFCFRLISILGIGRHAHIAIVNRATVPFFRATIHLFSWNELSSSVEVGQTSLFTNVHLTETSLGKINVFSHRHSSLFRFCWIPAGRSNQIKLCLILKSRSIWVDWVVETNRGRFFGIQGIHVVHVDTTVMNSVTQREAWLR